MTVSKVPTDSPALIPNLSFANTTCGAAIDWYIANLGASLIMKMPGPDGMVPHASLKFGNAQCMLHDVSGQFSMPGMPGPGPARLYFFTEDVDTTYANALANGATGIMPPADMFWGDRLGVLADPFGHVWSLASRNEALDETQIIERMKSLHAPAS